jgi:hypothetical protein
MNKIKAAFLKVIFIRLKKIKNKNNFQESKSLKFESKHYIAYKTVENSQNLTFQCVSSCLFSLSIHNGITSKNYF